MATRPVLVRALIVIAVLVAATLPPLRAAAIEINDPNLSADAAYCRKLTGTFRQTIAARAGDPALDATRKAGERGAYLCRFERTREGIALLERALATLRDTPAK
jgi:hypothetical protein